MFIYANGIMYYANMRCYIRTVHYSHRISLFLLNMQLYNVVVPSEHSPCAASNKYDFDF